MTTATQHRCTTLGSVFTLGGPTQELHPRPPGPSGGAAASRGPLTARAPPVTARAPPAPPAAAPPRAPRTRTAPRACLRAPAAAAHPRATARTAPAPPACSA